MHNKQFISSFVLLFIAVLSAGAVNAEQAEDDFYKDSKFALGVGTAIVQFDTNAKYTDKKAARSTYLDLEGNLDLPEVSAITTLYGVYQFSPKHRLGFSFFNVNRESNIFNIDKTFEDVKVVGNASITDTTDFYRLDYGYSLFNDGHSKIDLVAGIYALDLKYVFNASGEITIDGVTTEGSIEDETKVFAPLPLIGLDFLFRITDRWNFETKVAFVTGSHDNLSANVFNTSINALYRFNRYLGVVIGLAHFNANIVIEDNVEKQDITYGYDGAYIGMHFFL